MFRRERLPAATEYYAEIGLRLLGRGAWRSTSCPFHDDAHPSLRVNVESGAFRCMACGAHGGDVLAFHRLRTGKRFVDAARELGAWVGDR
jgi:DNA primase